MFNHVVTDNKVKLMFQLLEFEDIGRNESGLDAFLFKIFYSRLYLVLCNVNAGNIAAFTGKRQQVSSFAAAYLNDFQVFVYIEEFLDVRQEIFVAGNCKLVKILFVVTMSGLHIGTTFLDCLRR